MSERLDQAKETAKEAAEDTEKLASLIEDLSGESRRRRQSASAAIYQVVLINRELLVPYIDDLVDALNHPEAQTRWECLASLTQIVDLDSRACDKAISGAEASLFDEDNGTVRLAAMQFLCKLGATTPNRSEKVWPLIDEAIQCYHGDLEFNEMMDAITGFASGKLSDTVKTGLADRMRFDAESGKGSMKKRAAVVMDTLGMK